MQLANTIKCKSWNTTDPRSSTWEGAFKKKTKYSALENEKTFIYRFKNMGNVKNERVLIAVHRGKRKKCVISFIYPYIIGLLIIMYVKSLPVLLLSCKTRCTVN